MGIFRYEKLIFSAAKFREKMYAPMAACLTGLVILTGCVSDSTLPSQNVGVALSPQESNTIEGTDKLNGNLAVGASQKTTRPSADLSPTVKNALIPTNAKATPAQAAVTDIAKAEPADQQNNSTTTQPAAKKQASLFGALFSNNSKSSLRVDKQSRSAEGDANTQPATTIAKNSTTRQASLSQKASSQRKTKTQRRRGPRIKATLRNGAIGLPGVRIKKLFGIDTQETEEFDEPVQVAGVANLARRGTHGLLLQRPDVKVGCFPRKLLRILKRVERRFGRTPIVTSGYRSPGYNRRVRGARNSTHIRCHAADIQVKGVSKWTLAKYLRTIPGRGGVGTYCHTKSVHIDIGKKRAWNYCKRRRKKRRRS